jgi:hypothetical protein
MGVAVQTKGRKTYRVSTIEQPQKSNECQSEQRHWLDPAEKKFGPKFICGVKDVLGVSKLFLLYPVFWGLFDQMVLQYLN